MFVFEFKKKIDINWGDEKQLRAEEAIDNNNTIVLLDDSFDRI